MTTRRRTHLLYIVRETDDEMLVVEGPDPWVSVARIPEGGRLSDLDAFDFTNAGTEISIRAGNFSYLLPEGRDGQLATDADLLSMYERERRRPNGFSFETQYRYGVLIGTISNLMEKRNARMVEETAVA